MYNVYDFGKRIASYRKMAGLTQEELAARLNITPQAVSKWENEISFPEITILPELARVLNTTIDKLFGNKNENGTGSPRQPAFPPTRGNLKLIHVYRNVACYSNKAVDVIVTATVTFEDGSQADLGSLRIVNKGPGEIVFDFADEHYYFNDLDLKQTEFAEVFTGIKSLELAITCCQFRVGRSSDNVTKVSAKGSSVFIEYLEVRQSGQSLVIAQKQPPGNVNFGSDSKLEILLGHDSGDELQVYVNGSGSGEITIPFKEGRLHINGSGALRANSLDTLRCTVNGSGDVECQSAKRAEITIRGSGDVNLYEATEELNLQISGSGDICIDSGQVETFNARISGSGDINAKAVTARFADMAINGSGEIVLGRVIEESVEQHSKHASITVLKRG